MKYSKLLYFVSIALMLYFVFGYWALTPDKQVVFLDRELLLTYIVLIVPILHKTIRYVNLMMLFVASFSMFLCGRVFLSLFDESILFESDKFTFYTMTNNTVHSVLCMMGVSLTMVIIGFVYSYNQNILRKKEFNYRPIIHEKSIKKILKLLLLIAAPGAFLKMLYDFIQILTYGFLVIYMDSHRAPFILRASWGAFNILFPMFLFLLKDTKDFRKYIIMYFLTSTFSLITGSRSAVLIPIMFFMWFYYAKFSTKDLSKKILLGLFAFVALMCTVLLLLRSDGGTFESAIFFNLLNTQGVTYVFLGNYLDLHDQFVNQSSFYIIHPLLSTILRFTNSVYTGGQTYDLVKQTLNLDDQMMYITNPDMYFKGAGYGSCYIAELHALGGLFAIIIGSFMIGRFINWIEQKKSQSQLFTYFTWYLVPHILFMPRSCFFPDPIILLLGFLMFKLIKYIALKSTTVTK